MPWSAQAAIGALVTARLEEAFQARQFGGNAALEFAVLRVCREKEQAVVVLRRHLAEWEGQSRELLKAGALSLDTVGVELVLDRAQGADKGFEAHGTMLFQGARRADLPMAGRRTVVRPQGACSRLDTWLVSVVRRRSRTWKGS